VAPQAEVPEAFELFQNYPNPFNPSTTIRFTLPTGAIVTMKVYNMLGQEVTTLLNHEEFGAGEQNVLFDADGYPSGVYFYRIVADGIAGEEGIAMQAYTRMMKMVLLK
jgi:hypothetical protein